MVQAYWRQSRQKWKVPANCSLEGEAVETAGAPTSGGVSGARRPNRPSLPRVPSLAAGFGSGAVNV